jgi:hypothetical protein
VYFASTHAQSPKRMSAVIGDLLPLAVGVAISPLPIIALVVLLIAPKAGAASWGFLFGWVCATTLVLVLFALISGVDALKSPETKSIVAVFKIVLGAALLALAVKEWRARPRAGARAELPHWLSAVQAMKAPAVTGMGFVIYLANPKNLALGAAAGVALAQGNLARTNAAIVAALYVLIASSSVLLPTLAYAFEKDRMRPWLDELKVWLTEHNAAVMAVVLGLMGAVMVGKGIAHF